MVVGGLDRESTEEYILEIMVKDGGIPIAKQVSLRYIVIDGDSSAVRFIVHTLV